MTIKTEQYLLPAYWACALINGDLTGYSDDEIDDIQDFQREVQVNLAGCVCLDADIDSTEFSHRHDGGSIGGAECCTFTFQDFRLDDSQVKTTTIGSLDKEYGCDQYIMMDIVDGECNRDQAFSWLLQAKYKLSSQAGDWFCTAVDVLPEPYSRGTEKGLHTAWIGIVHWNLDC